MTDEKIPGVVTEATAKLADDFAKKIYQAMLDLAHFERLRDEAKAEVERRDRWLAHVDVCEAHYRRNSDSLERIADALVVIADYQRGR